MTPVNRPPVGFASRTRIGPPPIPREHSAWVILYCPLLPGFGATAAFAPLRWMLLVLAVTGAFLAREAAGLLFRQRARPGTVFWLGVSLTLLLAGSLPVLCVFGVTSLALIGGLAALLFGAHSMLLVRRRQDRSLCGEILGVGALTLTAPAARVAVTGGLDARAGLLWLACMLYFSSGIVIVKMILNAVKVKREWSEAKQREIGRNALWYHLTLAVALCLIAPQTGAIGGWLAAAYLPALVRAFYAYTTLTPVLPPLKQVGMRETLLALWFAVCLLGAFRVGH